MAWVITATALVWLMIPGVGFLYAGLLRRKNALSMMWMAMVLIAVVSFEVRAVDASSPPHLTPRAVVLLGLLARIQRVQHQCVHRQPECVVLPTPPSPF